MRTAARSIFVASALLASLGALAWDGNKAVTSVVSDVAGTQPYVANGKYVYRSALQFYVQCPAAGATVAIIDVGGRGSWDTETCDANSQFVFTVFPSELPNASDYAQRNISIGFADAAGNALGTVNAAVSLAVSSPQVKVTAESVDAVNRRLMVNVSTFGADADGPTHVYVLALVSGGFYSLKLNADGGIGLAPYLGGDVPVFTTANALAPDQNYLPQPLISNVAIPVGGFKPGAGDMIFVGYGQSVPQLLEFSKYKSFKLADLLP